MRRAAGVRLTPRAKAAATRNIAGFSTLSKAWVEKPGRPAVAVE